MKELDATLIDIVQEYAMIRRGEHPKWTGDRILNSETFAYRLGFDYPLDAPYYIQNLDDAKTEYVLLTGLPPRAIALMACAIKQGAREGLRQAKADGRT